jgi:ketosteroid isomerase-like protein
MAPENPVTLVERAYAAFARGDLAALDAVFAADAEFESAGDPRDLPHGSVGRDPAGRLGVVLEPDSAVEVLAFEATEVVALGPDRVLARGTERLLDRQTGEEVLARWVHLFAVRDGRIAAGHEWSEGAARLTAQRGL